MLKITHKSIAQKQLPKASQGLWLRASMCDVCVNNSLSSLSVEEYLIGNGIDFNAYATTSLTTQIQDDPFTDWPDLR